MILRLKLNNWGIFENREFIFSKGKNLIFGPNFSGKSSILNAIYFAITGSLPNGLAPGEMVKKGAAEGVVELDFSVSNGEEYRVRRRIKKGGKTAQGNLYSIRAGEEKAEVKAGNEEVTQEILDKLGIGEKYLLQAIFMREGDIYRTLTKPEKGFKEELNRLLKVSRLNEVVSTVNSVKNELKKDIDKRKNKLKEMQEKGNLKPTEDIKNQLSEIRRKIEELNHKLINIEEEKNALWEEKRSLEELTAVNENLDKLKEKEDETLRSIQAQSLEEIIHEIKSKENKINATRDEITELKGLIEGKKLEKERIEQDIKRLEEGIKVKYTKCPTCEKPLTEIEAREVIKRKKRSLSKIENEIKIGEEKLQRKNRLQRQLNDQLIILKKSQEKLQGIKREREELEKRKREITERLSGSLEDIKQKIMDLETQVKELTEAREKLLRQEGRLEGLLTLQKGVVGDIRKEIENLYHQHYLTEVISKAAEKTAKEIAQRALEGVKKDVKAIWEESHGGTWDIEFDNKKLLPIIRRRKNESYVVEQLSGAEKVTLFVALRISFARNLGNPGFLIFDEPFEHLDDQNKEMLKGVLNKISSAWVNQVIISSYEKDVKEDSWDNVIELDTNVR